jgi:hypothetical protein
MAGSLGLTVRSRVGVRRRLQDFAAARSDFGGLLGLSGCGIDESLGLPLVETAGLSVSQGGLSGPGLSVSQSVSWLGCSVDQRKHTRRDGDRPTVCWFA